MSKASTASLPKTPQPATSASSSTATSSTSASASGSSTPLTTSSRPVSAWSKGPPLAARSASITSVPAPVASAAAASAPAPAPAKSAWNAGSNPPSGTVTPTGTHGRKASIVVKDGVAAVQGNGASAKPGSAMSFGSVGEHADKPGSNAAATAAAVSPTVSDAKTFGSLPAAAKKDDGGLKKDGSAAADKKDGDKPKDAKPKRKIDVNALFQAVPQNSSASAAPSPSPSNTTGPSLPPTSPPPPAAGTPVTGRSAPNGPGAPSNIYNSVPMRPPPGQNMPMMSQMGMMPGNIRPFVPSGPGRGGPPGGPNGVGRGEPNTPGAGRGAGPQQQPGSPPPHGRGQSMMSPMMGMMPPGGPGSPWTPYYAGLPHYYPGGGEPGQGMPNSPYPAYWHPQGMPGMAPHPGMQGMPGQGPQGPPYPHPGMPGQQGSGMVPQMQGHPGFPGGPHLGPPQTPGHPMSPGGQGRNLPSMQQQQQQGVPVPPGAGQPPAPGPPGAPQQVPQHTGPGTPLSISGLPSPMPAHVTPHGHGHIPLPPNPAAQQGGLPPPTPLSHPQTPSSLRTALPGTPNTPSFRYPGAMPPPTPGGSQLNSRATEFVPSSATRKAIKITREDGTLVSLPQHVRTPSTMVGGAGASSPSPVHAELKDKVEVVRKPSAPVRMESEADKARREKEAREKAEAEERKVKEEEERKKREEEERVEKERKEKEEEERRVREEEERKKREEEERLERERKEAEEKVRKEAEEKARIEAEAKAKAEAEEKARKDAEEKAKLDAEAAAKAKLEEERILAEAAAKAQEIQREAERRHAEEAAEKADTLSALPSSGPSASQTPTSPSTPELGAAQISLKPLNGGLSDSKGRRPVPGPLDLKSAVMAAAKATPPLSSAQASALLSARPIEDINAIQYPAHIRTPNPDLNANGPPGKFRYDRDFLMQFMTVCMDRPETLPPLEAIGIENSNPMAQEFAGGRTPGGATDRRGSRTLGGKVGLGISGGPGAPFGGRPGFSMGNFQAPTRAGADGDRFRSVSSFAPGVGAMPGRPVAIQRTASGSGLSGQVPGSPGGGNRNRSLRGRQRPESRQPSQAMAPPPNIPGFEPVEPLTKSENRWKPTVGVPRGQRGEVADTPEVVERKVKALLNKLTLEKFDSISDQIVAFANRSEQETDGHTLIHVIKLVFEKATDEPAWSEMYARLCRKMMERISPKVFDVQIKNNEGALIVGGQLFRKYLLNRCQEDFERGWAQRRQLAEEAAAAGPLSHKEGEEEIFSDAYYAAQKAKRRSLGLVKLIGELFKLQMLTERIMHECIRKMLANVENPEEEEVESLCKLLTTVGQQLDTEKAKAHMTIYFSRMKEMVKILKDKAERKEVSSRMMFMLQDIIDLREKYNWQPRQKTGAQGPMTIAEVHQAAQREEALKEAEKQRQAMSRGGSRRGDAREYGPDGWQNVPGGPAARPPPPAKAGDLSKFGNISKPSGPIGGFGPSNVFNKKVDPKGARAEAAAPPTRTNMFNVLNAPEAPAEPEAVAPRAPSRKPSVDLGGGAPAADAGSQRKKLKLLPRSIPLAKEDESQPPSAVESVDEVPSMSEEKAKAKIEEDVKEFWQVGDLDEAANYFKDLPSNYHDQLIDKFVSEAFNKKDADVAMVADVFTRCATAGTVSVESFKKGLGSTAEFLDDIAVDVPQAYAFMAKLIKGAQLSQPDVEELAGKISVEGDPLVAPKDKLLKEVAKLA